MGPEVALLAFVVVPVLALWIGTAPPKPTKKENM